ncbi:uncharacterized protein LOC115210442 [Octopus sinensis]|uniref:Uncharacterized protein LOC115210442 n=1 Tax=Octopus sinensis TaxID=2607531 RepID=A0A6P7S9A4_9MOLL|nr:uncharacterized protein LOC115210442 [Octopus sinensis]
MRRSQALASPDKKCGRASVETAPIPRRIDSAIVDDIIHKVEATILEDHRITIRQLGQEVRIRIGSVEKIIHDHLHMWKLFARWITRITHFQMQDRVSCTPALLAMRQENEEDLFGRHITHDKTWVHHYDPESKVQSKQ